MKRGQITCAFLLFCLVYPVAAIGQVSDNRSISLLIVEQQRGGAVAGAAVVGRGEAMLGRSNADGRALILGVRNGDTLAVVAVGYAPTTVVVDTTVPLMIVELRRSAAVLTDLVAVTADALVRGGASEWSVSGEATRLSPFAGEPDAFRVLSLVPAVTFSSILSSRPMIRGIDAADAGFSIDGHEAINLHHVGRFFSAFPALGVGTLDVLAQPARLGVGRTTSGRIDINGARWAPDRRTELQYGLGAWSAATGWNREGHEGVLVGRTVEGALAGAADDGSDVSLSIGDLYGRLDLGTSRRTSLTFYHSIDRIVDRDPDDGPPGNAAGLDWGNLLVGATSELKRTSDISLRVRGSYASHFENGTGIPGRGTTTGVENRIRRLNAGLEGEVALGLSGAVIEGAAELGRREVLNRLNPADPARIPAVDMALTGTEAAGHLGLAVPTLGGVLRVGVRGDVFSGEVAWQPRLSFAASIGERWWVSAGAGRAARTMHMISDARTEPKIAWYDVWLPVDGDSIPPATVDHYAAEIGWSDGRRTVRGGAFAARGKNAMEFVPEHQSVISGMLLRSGDLRVLGAELEARASSVDGKWAGQATWTLQVSERNWGEGWLPWVNDRRHLLRIAGIYRPSGRTVISTGVEAGTGQPYTPILGIDSTMTGLHTRYGAENSARGRAGLRIDAAVQREFNGPFGTDMSLGLSVMNIAAGDQSPRKGSLRFVPQQPGGPVVGAVSANEQLFSLPPIPTLLLRVRF